MRIIPQKILSDLNDIKGFDKEAFLAVHQQAAVTSVRLHPLKQTSQFQENEQVPWFPQGRYLPERPVFTLDPAYHAGAYYVQEASSMFLHHAFKHAIGKKTGMRVLDLCAAPGGKSTLIASLLDRDSLLISNEVIRTRASILEENMTRWGYGNTWVTSNDPRDIGKLRGYFNVIVADVPCSGSGLFRKDAKAINEWSEANVQLCCQRQERILADILPALKEDGILIYSTCSFSKEEDEDILDWLAQEYDIASVQIPLNGGWGIEETVSEKGMYGYRFFPHKVKGEGFFIAALQKKQEQSTVVFPKFKSGHDKKVWEQAEFLLNKKDVTCIPTDKDVYAAIHPNHEADYQLLQKALYLRKAGLTLGSPNKKDWIPAHEVALSVDKSSTLPIINVKKEDALLFLKKENFELPDVSKGWYLVAFEGLALGWIKALGNRFNNYLPKHWRIRMNLPDEEQA